MAYEATKVVKTLRFPGDTATQYQVNAVRLEGHTWNEIDQRFNSIESFDALRYMGALTAGSTLPSANKGDVYKITTAGTIAGAKVEIGDMLICNTDNTAANTPANWDIIQANIDMDALLAHTHSGNVSLSKSDKTLEHTIVPTTANITATFDNGAATVTGTHKHTASGSVSVTPGGTISDTSVTPAGTVTLTSPTTAATNDVVLTPSGTVANSTTSYVTSVTVENHEAHTHTGTTNNNTAQTITGTVTVKTGTGTANYTPAGTVGNSDVAVTEVTPGSTAISAHKVTESTAGAHTPEGTVTVTENTATGSVASHNHSVKATTTEGTHTSISDVTTTWTAGDTEYDGTVTIGTSTNSATYIKSVSVTEQSVAPAFTGTAHSHTATFAGKGVAGHKHSVSVDNHEAIVPSIQVTKGNHNHSFSGTGVQLVATHSLTAPAHNHAFTTDENTKGLSHSFNAPTSAHAHTFQGNKMNVHATFAGTAASHKHDFTGSAATHGVTVNVDNYTGNFTGSATGNVTVKNGTGVLTGVTVSDHTISTVDTASVTTGTGKQ